MKTILIPRKGVVAQHASQQARTQFMRLNRLSTAELYFFIALTGFLSQSVLNTAASMVGSVVPFVTGAWFTPAAIYIPLGLYLLALLRDRQPLRVLPFLYLYGLLVAFLLYTLILHPDYATVMFDSEWNGSIRNTLLSPTSAVLAFLMVTMAPSGQLLLLCFTWASYLTFTGNIVRYVIAQRRGYWIGVYSDGSEFQTGYDLGFGYSVLLSVVVFSFLAFSGRRPLLHTLGAVIGVFMILTGGSRAPLGVAALAVVLLALHFRRRLFQGRPGRVAAMLFLGGTGAVIAANLTTILVAIQSWMTSRGQRSRSLDTLIEGSFTESNARDTLGEISTRLVQSGGPFGHGLYGDRVSIRPLFHWGYPHNIVDEFLITYGWLGGSLLLFSGSVALVLAYRRSRGTLHADLIVLVIPLIFQLWVSMSYLLSVWFWVLCALIWRALTHPRTDLGRSLNTLDTADDS